MREPDILIVLGQSQAGGWMAGALAAAGVALMTVTLLRGIARRRQGGSTPRGARAAAQAPPQAAKPASNTSIAHERAALERLMVEVQELTRVCAAQIENRATKLEVLIAQADERIASLEGKTSAPGPPVVTNPIAPKARAHPPGAPTPPPTSPRAPDELRHQIETLAQEGESAQAIAAALDEPIGKVELILALQQASRASQSTVRG